MVEPFAAVVLNSMLSSRPSASTSALIQSAVRVMTRPTRAALPSDFFSPSPSPRRVKGKEKAVDVVVSEIDVGHGEQNREWSWVLRYSFCYSKRQRLLLLKEFPSRRERPTRRYSNHHIPPAISRRPPSNHIPMKRLSPQARHASNVSEALGKAARPQFSEGSSSNPDPPNWPADPGPSDGHTDVQDFPGIYEDPELSQVLEFDHDPEMPSTSFSSGSMSSPNDGPKPLPPWVYNPVVSSAKRPPERLAATQLEALGNFRQYVAVVDDKLDLQDAWDIYRSVEEHAAFDSLEITELLNFVDKFVTTTELFYEPRSDIDAMHYWGERILSMFKIFEQRLQPRSSYDSWRQTLLSRATALIGNMELAALLLRKISGHYTQHERYILCYIGIFRSISRHYGVTRVLEYIAVDWEALEPYLKGLTTLRTPLRRLVVNMVANVHNPPRVLSERKHWLPARRQVLGELLIEVLCKQKEVQLAWSVYQEMQRQQIPPSMNVRLLLVRSLAQGGFIHDAKSLFSTCSGNSDLHLSTGLHLHSYLGDIPRVRALFRRLVKRNRQASSNDMAQLMYAYARLGQSRKVVYLFDKYFPTGADGRRMNSPQSIDFSIVIYAFAQAGDLEGMNQWLEAMSAAGIPPSLYVFNNIMRSLAVRGDLESATKVLEQIQAAGLKPNAITYTIIITLLAHRKDPVSAERIYKRAVAEGVHPDRRMISSLMNAHVEAGSWHGVIRAFDFLRSARHPHVQLTIEVYNTLLKAYVLIGTPFRVVSRLFTKLEAAKVRPDVYTYSLLVQSACDAGLMKIAEHIFHEMERLSAKKDSNIEINAYVMTILMAGYLEKNQQREAKAVYDDMLSRGINPTAVTYGTVLKNYARHPGRKAIKLSELFIRSLVRRKEVASTWIKPTHGKKSTLELVYGPVLRLHAQLQRSQDAERLYRDMLDAGGEPSLGTLASLLNVHRRTFNIDAATLVWRQIFELGLRYRDTGYLFPDETADDGTHTWLQGNIICIPLSIYIDALSSAGRHSEIAVVWKECQSHGFTFDPHNWNHLMIALVRAGELERAFDVLEKVIIPYQRQAEKMTVPRDPEPDSPLIFDEPVPHQAQRGNPPMHRGNRRSSAVKESTLQMQDTLDFKDDFKLANDFAHPLHVMHQLSPAWNIWRAHAYTLTALLRGVIQLRLGRLLRPVQPGDHLKDGTLPEEAPPVTPQEAAEAHAILARIGQNSPNAMAIVYNYERDERRFDTFDEKYFK